MPRSPRAKENETSRFRLRRAAEDDLLAIAEYTIERWGEAQADAYIGQLDRTFHELAAKPDMGKNADDNRRQGVLKGGHNGPADASLNVLCDVEKVCY